jgi:hypothetical protein
MSNLGLNFGKQFNYFKHLCDPSSKCFKQRSFIRKGVKNPNLKRDSPEEKHQRDSLYDQEKRIRTFQESWKAI